MSETIRFIDLFGGIGGFRHGLEQSSDKFKCVDYIEYDEYAVKSYNEIFGEEHEPRDVTQLQNQEIRDHDLLCAGFPCQSFSVAGNRQGTDEARGKLFREIVRIAEAHEPEMLLLENVKGILSQKAVQNGEAVKGTKGHAFTEVLQALHELGYCLEWQVLNSKNWGVPQNRERVFIIGHLGGEPQRKVFPIRRSPAKNIKRSHGSPVLIDNEGKLRSTSKTVSSGGNSAMDDSDADFVPVMTPSITNKNQNMKSQVGSSDNTMFTVDKSIQHGVLQIPRGNNDGKIYNNSPTVSSNSWEENNFLTNKYRIRKLTPKECWRLQGFPDSSFEAAEEVNSDTQLYKQAGNAVTVNVIKALGEEIRSYFDNKQTEENK